MKNEKGEKMDYKSLTQLLSESKSARGYFMSLPVELQLELHKYSDSVRSPRELYETVEKLNRDKHYEAIGVFPHEYLLY